MAEPSLIAATSTQRSRSGLTCGAPPALSQRAQHAAPLHGLRAGKGGACRRLGHPGRGAGGEFGGGEAALAVETAEKIVGELFAFLGVAFHAAGDKVAVGAWQSLEP